MSILNPPKESTRLVTQNLLISAAAAAQPGRRVTEENVNDLATVISLSCLYDRLVLVGPHHLLDFDAPILSYLRNDVVEIRQLDDDDWRRGIERAGRYAGAFLCVGGLQRADEIFEGIYEMSRRYGSDLEPDDPDDIYTGRHLLDGVASADDLRARLLVEDNRVVLAYVLRTFLYIAFSDQLRVPIAVDAARHELVSEVAHDSHQRLREAVLATLGDSIKTNAMLPHQVRAVASPFAAIAFAEASDRSQLVSQISALRDEYLDLRMRLRPLEQALETSVGYELEQAQARMSAVLDSIKRRAAPKGGEHLFIRRVLAWAKPLADLLSFNPGDALTGAAESLLQKDAETTLAELHKLQRRQPATAEQDASIKKLFNL